MAFHLRSKPKNTWEGRVDRWSAGWMGLIHPRWCRIELPCNSMLTMLWRSFYSWIISETYRITSNHIDSNSNHTKWITVLARSHKPSLIRVSSNSTREAHFASPLRDRQDFSLPDTPYSTDRGHFHFCEAARTGDLSTVLLTAFTYVVNHYGLTLTFQPLSGRVFVRIYDDPHNPRLCPLSSLDRTCDIDGQTSQKTSWDRLISKTLQIRRNHVPYGSEIPQDLRWIFAPSHSVVSSPFAP